MAGRRLPPQVHFGGNSLNGASRSSRSAPHRMQRHTQSVPCSSITSRLPAAWCSRSTFCVMSVNLRCCFSTACCSRASARCAGFGFAAAHFSRRQSYQRVTVSGSRANASGVASWLGSYLAQSPSIASRNVGIPLSAETPAPVSTTTACELCRALTNGSGMTKFTFTCAV